ncbi:MAG: GNAT family N-acetyltransferase [Pseudomonadota bacterium]
MIVRPLHYDDRQIWEDLFSEYAAFYKTEIPEGGFDRTWAWIFDDAEDFWCDLCLTHEGQASGFTQYQLMHRSLSGSKVCYLSDLYVRPEVRGQGAGRKLIDHVVDFARARGVTNVRWLTQEFNYPARKLYDSYAPKSDFILYSIRV